MPAFRPIKRQKVPELAVRHLTRVNHRRHHLGAYRPVNRLTSVREDALRHVNHGAPLLAKGLCKHFGRQILDRAPAQALGNMVSKEPVPHLILCFVLVCPAATALIEGNPCPDQLFKGEHILGRLFVLTYKRLLPGLLFFCRVNALLDFLFPLRSLLKSLTQRHLRISAQRKDAAHRTVPENKVLSESTVLQFRYLHIQPADYAASCRFV